jgi:hypothetical protein
MTDGGQISSWREPNGETQTEEGSNMLLKIRHLAIASAVAVTPLLGLSAVSASAASPQIGSAHAIPLVTGPNTNLVGSGTTVVYSPKKLLGLTAVSQANCSTSDYSFSISNTTAKTQKVTSGGSVLVKIPAGEAFAICVFNDGAYKLGLSSSPLAKLKITVTM